MHGLEPGGPLVLALFLTGLASGVHCAGMCGGIVAAFSVVKPAPSARNWIREIPRQLAFNLGRIASYALAGGLAGSIAAAGMQLAQGEAIRGALHVAASLLLVAAGLHLAGWSGFLRYAERLGRPVWRVLQPRAVRVLAVRNIPAAVVAGALWGWIPCGLVYAALAGASLAGSAQAGALAMAAFGAGTLPNLLLAGVAAARLRAWMGRGAVRIAAGSLVAGFGLIGLARATGFADTVHAGILCLT